MIPTNIDCASLVSVHIRDVSCGGHGLGEALLGLDEGVVAVADWDGHELHLSPYGVQGDN